MIDDEISNLLTPNTGSTASTGAASGQQSGDTEATQTKVKAKVTEQPPGQNVVAGWIVENLAGVLTHDPVTGEWFQRSGNIFSSVPEAKARLIIRRELQSRRSNFAYGYLSGVASFVRDDLSLFEWTSDKNLLPLQDGLIDLNSGELRDYKPTDRFRSCLPIKFDSKAVCTDTVKILKQIAGNDDVYNLIIACLYVILTRRHDLQKYFELLGPGGTGKSTLVELFTRLVGESNRAVTELKELENNRFESASLYGKYLIVVNDAGRYAGDVSKLKAMTGGDPLRNEVKNRQQAEPFIVEGVVVIAANEPIQSKDYSTGLTRRRTPIYLTYEITDADKARYPNGVGAVFDAELPGLLNLLMQQNEAEMIGRIMNPTESIKAGKLQAELATNPLLQWADDFLIPAELGKESPIGNREESQFNGLYSSYCHHCESGGNSPVALNRFSDLLEQQLKSRDIDTRRHRTNQSRIMRGLCLRNINDTDTPNLLSRHIVTS